MENNNSDPIFKPILDSLDVKRIQKEWLAKRERKRFKIHGTGKQLDEIQILVENTISGLGDLRENKERVEELEDILLILDDRDEL